MSLNMMWLVYVILNTWVHLYIMQPLCVFICFLQGLQGPDRCSLDGPDLDFRACWYVCAAGLYNVHGRMGGLRAFKMFATLRKGYHRSTS